MAIASPPRPPKSDALVRPRRKRRRRTRVFAGALVAAAAAIAFIGHEVAQTTAAPCLTGRLSISLLKTGAEGGLLRFDNVGPSACQISGWPTVVAVESNGKQIASLHKSSRMIGWGGLHGQTLPSVRLPHGGAAYASLESGDKPVGPNPRRSCPAARRLLVTPPNTHLAAQARISSWPPNVRYLRLCWSKIAVSPVLPYHALWH
jgi:Protein of unknown function (DUF4232)